MTRTTALLAVALVACGPNPKAPVKVMAIIPDSSRTFSTQQVQLTTITDMTALKGSAAVLLGGNRVSVDPNDPLQTVGGGLAAMDDATLWEVLVKDKGTDVRANYIDRTQVLWPADFHSWNMVTTYYNFERAQAYFIEIAPQGGVPELNAMRVMYWPEVHLNSDQPLTDNALYLSFIKSFVIVPFANLQRIPLAMNIGVIGHETSHKVFGKRVLQDAPIHPALGSWSLTPFNLLKSLDEGLADFHGWAVTCREPMGCTPNYLAVSIADDVTAHARDVSRADACMTPALKSAFNTFSQDQWVRDPSMYQVGSLFAVALYTAANKAGDPRVLEKALLTAYDDSSATTPGLQQLISESLNAPENFTPEAVANILVAHMPTAQLKKELCNELVTRLQLQCQSFPCNVGGVNLMPDCPTTSAGQSFCPTVP